MSLFAALRLPREILFGKGQRHALPTVAARLGGRALICTDSRFAATDVFAELVAGLNDAGVAVLVHDRVLPDVPRDTVGVCVEEARSFAPDMVIGIGGGSCLDMAKCAALLLSHGGALPDYYGEFKVPGPTLPVIAVLLVALLFVHPQWSLEEGQFAWWMLILFTGLAIAGPGRYRFALPRLAVFRTEP